MIPLSPFAAPFDSPTIRFVPPSQRADGETIRQPQSPQNHQATVASPLARKVLFDQRMTTILRSAVQGLAAVSAELRLLDDATTELRTSHYYAENAGYTPSRTLPLEQSQGDLTAMAGAMVVLDDAEMLAEWGATQRCQSAICMPVASDSTIHGALWLYFDSEDALADNELQLAELIAGRLAVEIERHWLLGRDANANERSHESATGLAIPSAMLAEDFLAEDSNAPAKPERIDKELVDGELERLGWAGKDSLAFHDARHLADGRMMTIVGAVVDTPGIETDSAAEAIESARRAAHRLAIDCEDAGELLTKISQAVYHETTGGEGLSIAVALIDREGGAGTLSLAGDAVALRVRASFQTPLSTGDPPIGWDDEGNYHAIPMTLEIRERLVLTIADACGGSDPFGESSTAEKLAQGFLAITADAHRRMTPTETMRLVKQQAVHTGMPIPSAMVVRRK